MTAHAYAPTRTELRRAPKAQAAPARKVLAEVPLLAILVVQALLSLRFVHSLGIDHGDESTYIYGGHQLIRELFHGGGSPYYETWFSGAPILYPIVAAMLDHVGGLTLVREFSLACLLGATTLLYLTGRRIFGYWTGLTAAGMFVALGITQRLGVLATFDAPSLLFLAAAAYAAVRGAAGSRWLLMAPPLLVIANALKYPSVVFDPVVIALGALQLRDAGWRRVALRGAALAAATGILAAIALFLTGTAYWHGILYTTLDRQGGAQASFGLNNSMPARAVIDMSWSWIGVVVVSGALALVVALAQRRERANVWLLALLIVAGLLVTAEGIRLQTDQSMNKHDDFGAWFTCIAAGYALARGAELCRRWVARLPFIIIALSVVVWTGIHYAAGPGAPARDGLFNAGEGQSLTAATQQYQFLAPWIREDPSGHYLIGGLASYLVLYSDHLSVPWSQWVDDLYIKYPVPGRGGDWQGKSGLVCGGPGQPAASSPGCSYLDGTAGFEAAIRAHAFAVVSLLGNHDWTNLDTAILYTVESTPGYVQISEVNYSPTFIYAPDYPAWERANPALAAAVGATAKKS